MDSTEYEKQCVYIVVQESHTPGPDVNVSSSTFNTDEWKFFIDSVFTTKFIAEGRLLEARWNVHARPSVTDELFTRYTTENLEKLDGYVFSIVGQVIMTLFMERVPLEGGTRRWLDWRGGEEVDANGGLFRR